MKARVRMYRQGLGDCFLLTFTDGDTTRNVLIDCGVLVGTENAAGEIAKVVADVDAATKSRGALDVLVATHEHWDHVSGFNQARDEFDALPVGQLWMAWTEDPEDDQANRLRAEREERKRALAVAYDLWKTRSQSAPGQLSPGMTDELEMTSELLDFFGEDLSAASGARRKTSDAMDYLRARPEPKHYLEPGMVRALPGLPEVRVYVLGPPRTEKWLKKERPSGRNPETYTHDEQPLTMASSFFAAVDVAEHRAQARPLPGQDMLTQPFDAYYRQDEELLVQDPFYGPRYAGGPEWRKIDYDWLAATSDLALALDSDTNNTSLVLAFELGHGGPVLLFPADAQVGNWLSWGDVSFGDGSDTTSEELLARTVFYKVGHHGSHNATLRDEGLEKMTDNGLMAMIPVDRAMAEKQRWNMPFPPLLERLYERCRGRVLLSDRGDPDGRRLRRLSEEDREGFLKRLDTSNPLYVDLEIEA